MPFLLPNQWFETTLKECALHCTTETEKLCLSQQEAEIKTSGNENRMAILVYTFLEDAVLSLNKEENSLKIISYFQVK